MSVQFCEKDIVNNGYATYRVMADHGMSVSVIRIDVGATVCRGTARLPKDMLTRGDIRKLEIDFV